MPLVYKKFDKHINVRPFHVVCENFKDVCKCIDNFIIPPIGGNWNICFIEASYQDVEKLKEKQFPNFIDITVFASEEVIKSQGIRIEVKSKWEQYLDYIATYPKVIENKAMKDIYYGMNQDLDSIFIILDKFADDPDITTITTQTIRNYISYESSIYPSDVVCSILCYKRNFKDFSKYNKRNPVRYIINLEQLLGKAYAFYAVRKYVKQLAELKLKYLNGKEIKGNFVQKNLIKVIDIYEIIYMDILMQSAQTEDLLILLELLERRETGASFFLKEILTHQVRNSNSGMW